MELFSPQSVPKVQPDHYKNPTHHFDDAKGPPPWGKQHRLARRRIGRDVWRHELYAGVYPVRLLRELLQKHFGEDPETYDERLDTESALFCLSISHDGRPLFDTAVLSTCAWAWGRTISPGPLAPDWLDGHEEFSKRFIHKVREELALQDGDEVGAELQGEGVDVGRPIALSDVAKLSAWVLAELGIDAQGVSDATRVYSRRVQERYAYEADGADFLNSFFVEDLTRVADEVEGNNVGRALLAYLAADDAIDESKRTDIRLDLRLPWHALAPERFPIGRWPSKGNHPLVYGQQFAINQLTRELNSSAGLFGVNGPPGTGKTTLLRDLVASVVVSRAQVLDGLNSPSDAFVGTGTLNGQDRERNIELWSDAFSGFEMVVASANNGAVENITLDIPGLDAVEPEWAEGFDYFTDFAERLIEEPAWGLLAARLGNKANRAEFRKRFWKDEETDSSANASPEKPAKRRGFSSWLFEQQSSTVDWSGAKTRFRQAVAEESKLRKQRQAWFDSVSKLAEALARERALHEDLSRCTQAERNAAFALEFANTSFEDASAAHTNARASLTEHTRQRPSILRIICSLGNALKGWRTAHRAYVGRELVASAEAEKARETVNALTEVSHAAALLRRAADQALQQTRETIEVLRSSLREAQHALGSHFPNYADWKRDDISRELSSPWADSAWNAARARVFLEALNLHKAFIVSQARAIQANIIGLFDILQGVVPPNAAPEAVRAAWRTLFFVVPVVSTTFASFDRLFAHLGREELGWLLIDEAGQAIPQSAIGGIWRARRAVVVGDPLQLEPVLTIPFSAQQALRKRFGVGETWLPGRLSAQKLADRVSRTGTTLLDHERKPFWVSSPLRVHRRCDEAMFKVSNKIAYNGMMVFGTGGRSELSFPETAWIHVEGADADGHWIPAEGEMVLSILNDVASDADDTIYVISPFRDVVSGLESLLPPKRFPNVEVGTIHTVQGKESDVVLLVLGGNPSRPGAKNWASKKPNLLNVAVSRAKRRLYIIGNRSMWKGYDNFDVCSEILGPRNTWVQPVESYLQ